METNQLVYKPFQAHTLTVNYIGFSPSGAYIVSGGRDEAGRVWDASTGRVVLVLTGHTTGKAVRAVTYSPDGRFISTGSEDKTVRLWDAETGQLIVTLYGHRGSVVLVGFTPDGESIVSGCDDETSSIWNVNAARLIFKQGDEDVAALAAATLRGGWLTGPSGELLIWVPAEYHTYLQLPPCTLRVDRCRAVIATGSDGWHRGETWTSCWRGGMPEVVSSM